jgi:hypothetical protein
MKIKTTLLSMLLALSVQAEKYTIYWTNDETVSDYSVDITCVETGFGTLKRFANVGVPEYTVELPDGLTYNIKVIAYSSDSIPAVSNTLVIRTKRPTPQVKAKAPIIRAKRVEDEPIVDSTITTRKQRRN